MVISYQNGNTDDQNGNKPPLIISVLTPSVLYNKRPPPKKPSFKPNPPAIFGWPVYLFGVYEFLGRRGLSPNHKQQHHQPQTQIQTRPLSF